MKGNFIKTQVVCMWLVTCENFEYTIN